MNKPVCITQTREQLLQRLSTRRPLYQAIKDNLSKSRALHAELMEPRVLLSADLVAAGAVLAVIGGSIVAFSWFHVNQLGVGLHSYGFTEGVLSSLWNYYYLVAAFVAVSLGGWYLLVRPRRNLGAA
mgnify:CR=1 FL=1